MKERLLFILVAVLIFLATTIRFQPATNPTGISQQRAEWRGVPQVLASLWPASAPAGARRLSPEATGGLLVQVREWLRPGHGLSWSGGENAGLFPASNRIGNTGDLFTIGYIEISQGIQNLEEPVVLIAGKATMVRVYLAAGAVYNEEGGEAVWGTLYVSGDNGRNWTAVKPENSEPPSPNREAALDRTSDKHALRFILPQTAVQGTLWAYVETFPVAAGERVAGAQPRQSKPVVISFKEKEPFRIAYVPIGYQDSRPEAERIRRAHTYMQMIFPLAEVQYYPLPYAGLHEGRKAGDAVARSLRRLQAFYHYSGWPGPTGEPDQLFGWLPHATWRLDGGSDPGWFNNGSGRVAFGTDTPVNQVYQMIMAHEIGHNLGRQHPICKYTETDWPHPTYAIHDVGFDFGFYGTSAFVHQETDDFMVGSHCRADIYDNKWISAHNYQKLHEALVAGPAARPPAAEALLPAGQPLYLVTGNVFVDGRADLETIYELTPQQPVSQPAGSDYCLALENDLGESLSRHCFDLSLEDAARFQPREPASFTVALPQVPGAARLVLRQGSEELAERPFSAHPPQVTLTSPAAGTALSGTVTIAWQGEDADGDPLTYAVAYSPDDGRNWYYLGLDLSERQLLVDMAELPGGGQALLRVLASDGAHTAVVTAGPFNVARQAPAALILLPGETVSLREGQTLLLVGYGHDLEDGLLEGDSLNWSSDLSGHLGSGKRLTVTGLPAGRHTITLSVTDGDGNTATATVSAIVE
jgi:hypothetical protein